MLDKVHCIRDNVYMIQITAYLRDDDDLKRWKALGNKTQFLHDALVIQDSTLHGTMYPKEDYGLSPEPFPKVIKTSADANKVVKNMPKVTMSNPSDGGFISKEFSARKRK